MKIDELAKIISGLDEGDMVELMMEVAMYGADKVIDMKVASQSVLEGLEDIEGAA